VKGLIIVPVFIVLLVIIDVECVFLLFLIISLVLIRSSYRSAPHEGIGVVGYSSPNS